MNKITKYILISALALGLFISTADPLYTCTVSAKNRNRLTRTYHHHRRVHIRKSRKGRKNKARRSKKRHVKSRKKVIRRRNKRSSRRCSHHLKSYASQMKSQTFYDINHDRKSHGVSPLKETHQLDRLAGVRAKQLVGDFSHYDRHGNVYYLRDAKAMHINLNHFYHHRSANGENIANAGLNYGNDVATNMPNNPKNYVNKNGYDMANMDDDAMFNYDFGSNWDHRKNILNRQFRNVGIGVAKKNGEYYLSEDFDS